MASTDLTIQLDQSAIRRAVDHAASLVESGADVCVEWGVAGIPTRTATLATVVAITSRGRRRIFAPRGARLAGVEWRLLGRSS